MQATHISPSTAVPPPTIDELVSRAKKTGTLVRQLAERTEANRQVSAEAIAQMRAAAERLLPPQFRDIVRLIDEPLLQPIYDLASPRLAVGRVALVGDAAFVARPHVGAGVSKAADDAAALAAALDGDDDVEAALRRYERHRLDENNRIIERARHLGAYLQATQNAEERTRSARHGIPEAVLAETATLDFLYV